MDMKLMMVLEMIDKVTKPLKKIHKATKKFANAEAKSRLATQKAAQAAKAAERGQVKYARSLNRTARMLKAQAKALNFSKSMMGKASLYTNYGARFGSAFGKSFKKSALRFTIGAAIGIGLGVGIGKGFVNTAASFEQFQTVLETLEGSSAKAQASMDWVGKFAVTTPYELEQVVESFVKLRSYGLDPTNGLLRTLGDTSAAMNKPLMQSIEAIADAVTGENERLKEFGIKASKAGGQIFYEYTQNGTTKVAKAMANDRAQIQKVLSDIFNSKFAGSMDKQSRTWNGMVSNMSDQWTKFQNMVMATGLFDWMKGKLSGILAQLDKWEANGELAAWAKSTGESIKTFFIGAYDFFVELKHIGSEVWPVIQQIGSAFKTAAEALGGWDKLAYVVIGLNFLGSFVAVAGIIFSIGAAFLSAAAGAGAFAIALLANPITWVVLTIVAAVAAIVYAAYQLYQNWNSVLAWFGNAWEWVKGKWNSFTDWLGGFWNDFLSMATTKINDIKSAFDVGLIAGLTEIFTSFSPVSLFIKAIDAIFSYFTGISLIDEGSKFVASLIEGFKQWDLLNWFVEQFTQISNFIGNKAAEIANSIKNALSFGNVSAESKSSAAAISKTVSASNGTNMNLTPGVKFGDFQHKKFATGGLLTGPGTGTSDSIPFMGSNGEFIINANATTKHLGILKAINSGSFGKSIKMTAAAAAISAPMMMPNLVAAAPRYMPTPVQSANQSNNINGASSSQGDRKIEINYSPTITISGGDQNIEATLKRLLKQHSHELTKMIEAEQRRNKRKIH